MVFPEIDPIALSIGPLAIRWYSLAYLVGLLGGIWYVGRLNAHYGYPIPRYHTTPPKKEGGKEDRYSLLESLLTHALLGVVLGGRLGEVLFYQPGYYLQHPVQILYVWQGGMSFHGGLLGVIFAIWLFARKYQLKFFTVIDLVACATPIGLGLGRITNFINGELWGRPTDVPWGIIFCNPTVTAMHGGVCPAGLIARHPSQLYEAFLEGLVLFLLLAWFAWRKHKGEQRGFLSGLFLTGYGLSRFTVEFVREPDGVVGFLTTGQALSLPMILLGLYLIHWSRRHKSAKADHADPAA